MKSRLFFYPHEVESVLGVRSELARALLNKEFGIINALIYREEFEKYGYYACQVLSCDKSKLFNIESDPTSGGLGVAKSKKSATDTAFFEAVERYSLASYTNLNLTSTNRLDEDERRYWNEPGIYNSGAEITTLSLMNIINGKKIQWPARKFYVPFTNDSGIKRCTSTGTATGEDLENAFESSVLEIIERHTLMCYHYLNLPTNELNILSIKNATLKKLLQKISVGRRSRIFELRLPQLPSVMLCIISMETKSGTVYGIGASCKRNKFEALEKSVTEALLTFSFIKHIKNLRKSSLQEVNLLHEHFLYYQYENFEKLSYINNISQIIPFADDQYSMSVLDTLKAYGITFVSRTDITPKDIASRLNIKVCRTIIPEMIDMPLSNQDLLASDYRIRKANQMLGIDRPFNRYPHPMP